MFKLHIAVTRASIDALKLDLNKTLREVKSMHRCEAMARAFGFLSYAALRAATKNEVDAGRREVDGRAFAAYLTKHGFEVDTAVLHRAVGRIAIGEVLALDTNLNIHGYGAGDWQRRNGVRETLEDRTQRVEAGRIEFASDYGVEQFLCALVFVSRIASTKLNNRRAHSYNLKHMAEKMPCTYPDGQPLGPRYVSNGALIVAATYAGFRFKTFEGVGGWPSLNVTFNMSSRSMSEVGMAKAA